MYECMYECIYECGYVCMSVFACVYECGYECIGYECMCIIIVRDMISVLIFVVLFPHMTTPLISSVADRGIVR